MEFAQIQKTSLVDYPGRICSTIFTIGCNFRCPFCHNRSLVLPEEFPKDALSEEQVLATLEARKKLVGAVCITGGEPTMHPELFDFIKKLKEIGLHVKLDSNGTNLEMLENLINGKLVDFVAMDIKTSLEKYPDVTGFNDTDKVKQSIELLKQGKVDYEFRTTVAPPKIVDLKELKKIIDTMLKGSKKYAIQKFEPLDSMIDPSLKNEQPYTEKDIRTFAEAVKDCFDEVELRGFG